MFPFGRFFGRTVPAEPRRIEPTITRDGSYSLAWPTPQLFGLFGGSGSNTGIPVTPISALQAPAVYACVRCLGEDISKLPVTVQRYVNEGEGYWKADRDHPLNNVLQIPNRWQTWFEFLRYMVTALELRGNAIAIVKRDWAGMPVELIPVNWDRVSVLLSPQGLLFYNVSHPQIGWGVTFSQDDVIHARGITVDGGYLGMTPVAAAADAFGLSIALQQHGAVLFRQGAQPRGIIKHPGKLTTEGAKRLAETWQGQYGGVQNSSKTAILEEGMVFEALTMTSEDAQFLESRAFQILDIARMFRVPPHKLFDLSKANFATVELAEQAYVNDSLHPRVVNLEAAFARALFFEDERLGYRINFNFRGLLRGDLKSRSDAYGSALNNGWLNINTTRAWEDLPPIKGGDVYRVPANTLPLDMLGKQQPGQTGAPGAGGKGGVGSDADPAQSTATQPVEQESGDQGVA